MRFVFTTERLWEIVASRVSPALLVSRWEQQSVRSLLYAEKDETRWMWRCYVSFLSMGEGVKFKWEDTKCIDEQKRGGGRYKERTGSISSQRGRQRWCLLNVLYSMCMWLLREEMGCNFSTISQRILSLQIGWQEVLFSSSFSLVSYFILVFWEVLE